MAYVAVADAVDFVAASAAGFPSDGVAASAAVFPSDGVAAADVGVAAVPDASVHVHVAIAVVGAVSILLDDVIVEFHLALAAVVYAVDFVAESAAGFPSDAVVAADAGAAAAAGADASDDGAIAVGAVAFLFEDVYAEFLVLHAAAADAVFSVVASAAGFLFDVVAVADYAATAAVSVLVVSVVDSCICLVGLFFCVYYLSLVECRCPFLLCLLDIYYL